MNSELALHIALVSYGNLFLTMKGRRASAFPDAILDRKSHSLYFVDRKKTWMLSKPRDFVIARDPENWFEYLKEKGCLRLKLRFKHSSDVSGLPDHIFAGFVGGGGEWILETAYESHAENWACGWQFEESPGADEGFWIIRYRRTTGKPLRLKADIDLKQSRVNLQSSLSGISEFASSEGLPHWAKIFENARGMLGLPAKEFHMSETPSMVPTAHPPLARQILSAAEKAWVFGGMGSWNDLGFEGNDTQKKYEELSARLYDALIDASVAAVNFRDSR